MLPAGRGRSHAHWGVWKRDLDSFWVLGMLGLQTKQQLDVLSICPCASLSKLSTQSISVCFFFLKDFIIYFRDSERDQV